MLIFSEAWNISSVSDSVNRYSSACITCWYSKRWEVRESITMNLTWIFCLCLQLFTTLEWNVFGFCQQVVEIRGVTAEGLRHVLGFIYTSELQLSMKNVQCVLSAAGHMQLKPIINFCKVSDMQFLLHCSLKRRFTRNRNVEEPNDKNNGQSKRSKRYFVKFSSKHCCHHQNVL